MRRFVSPLLLVLAAVLVGALLFSELDATGWLGLKRPARPTRDHARSPGLEADLARRARLRGLPGIERGDRGEGRVVGHVCVLLEGGGEGPLPDVHVEVIGIEGEKRVHRDVTTDAMGVFTVEDLPALVGYAVVVRHPPWREVVLRGINVSRDRTTDAGTLLLGAPSIVRGEVVDAAGRPIPGARAGLFKNTHRRGRFDLRKGLREIESAAEPIGEATTIEDGSFVLQDAPPGRYVLRVQAPGFATTFRHDVWVSVDERATALRVVLDPGAGFFGKVLDGEGHGVAGARVIAVAFGGSAGEGLDRAETQSGNDGTYRLDSLVPGVRYFLEAWAEGYAPRGRIVMSQEVKEQDLVLEPCGRVVGRITDDAGAPVAEAEIFLVAGAATGLSPLTTVSEVDGRYVFETVGPGPVMIFGADAPGHAAESFTYGAEHRHRVEAGETTVIDVVLDAGIEAEGRVLDARGRPVPYATVAFLDPRHRSEGEETSLTDRLGRWHVAGLRETTHEVRVQAPGYAPYVTDEDARVEVTGPSPWRRDFVLDEGATLSGRVLDPDGAGVAGARVKVLATGGRRHQERVQDLVAVSSPTGAWRLQGVPPRTSLRVEARHDGWAHATSGPLSPGPGQDLAVDLVLGEGIQVSGRVVDAWGMAIENARIRWGPLEGEKDRAGRDAFRADQRLGSRVVRSDPSGHFTIRRLEPGRWLVKVEHEGFTPWYRRDLVLTEEAAPFLKATLESSATVAGRVLDALSGRPIEGVWLYARESKDGVGEDEAQVEDPGRVPGLASTQTGKDGAYVIEGLAPGRTVEVVAWLAPGYRAAVQDRKNPKIRHTAILPGAKHVDFQLDPDDN